MKDKKNTPKQKDNDSNDDLVIKEEKFDHISTVDIEHAERVKLPAEVKGIKRTIRHVERKPKEAITKFDNKTFDAGFMPMHTKEFTYELLRKELQKAGAITDLVAEVNAGKEATIYIAHLNGAPLIVKAFRHQLTSHNRAKGNPQLRAASIASREYYLLTLAYKAGLRVPTPAKQINNTLLMRFVGENWQPAPQLRNTTLIYPEEYFNELIEQIWLLYNKAKLIHGDLSEYNILVFEDLPVIIDFPQAINMNLIEMRYPNNLKKNLQVMQKDIHTVCQYFAKEYNIDYDFQRIYEYIVGKDAKVEKIEFTIEEIEQLSRITEIIN